MGDLSHERPTGDRCVWRGWAVGQALDATPGNAARMGPVDRHGPDSEHSGEHACIPGAGPFDRSRRDTVLHLTDSVHGRVEPAEFFAEDYITERLSTPLTEGFRRLQGKYTQSVFKVTQAMGGGKTHNRLMRIVVSRAVENNHV